MFKVCQGCQHPQHCAIVEVRCPKRTAQLQWEQVMADWKLGQDQSQQIAELTNTSLRRRQGFK